MSIPPGPTSPYLIQLFKILSDPIDSLENWSQEYGETFSLGGEKKPTTVCFSSPEAIRTIFQASSNVIGYSQKSELIKSLLGDGSFIFLPEHQHQQQRKLIVPNWHKGSLNACGNKIINITHRIIGNLITNSQFDVYQVMKRISLEVILEEIFGSDDYLKREEIKQSIVNLFKLFESPILASYLLASRFLPNLLKQDIGIWGEVKHLQDKIDRSIYGEIAQRRKQKNSVKYDLLSLLTKSSDESHQLMTDKEIRDAILTLIFAGFETAATALSWMLYWVYNNSEVRTKLLAELNSRPRNIEPIEIAKLAYLEAICNETLRINPPALSTFARTVKQPVEIDGYKLESGTEIDVSIYLAHRRESVFPEPKKFNPERFIKKQFSGYEFLPFGGGQCRCLGANLAQFEMKLVLATIVSNFQLELMDSKPIKPKRHGIVMLPKGLKMKLVQ